MPKARPIKYQRGMKGVVFTGAIALVFSGIFQTELAHSQPANITLSPQFSPNPMELKGTGGGSTAINTLIGRSDSPTGPCTGYANATPNHTVTLRAFFNSLSVNVDSPQDTALVIQGPGGTWCNDDMDGKNPGITGQWLPGKYDIWVTTYAKDKTAPYVLKMTGK